MNSLTPYNGGDDDLAVSLAHQQQLMVQMLQSATFIQGQLKRRLDEHEQDLQDVRATTAELVVRTRRLEMASSLITINMLDTMLAANWTEADKNRIGKLVTAFSRKHHVVPTKVPHPTVPRGVNGYQPSIVKAWLEEETDYDVPLDLRYVD